MSRRVIDTRQVSFKRWFRQWTKDVFESAQDVWGWSLPELAEHAGVSGQTCYNYSKGKIKYPRMETVWKFCKAVGMDETIVREDIAALHHRIRARGRRLKRAA